MAVRIDEVNFNVEVAEPVTRSAGNSSSAAEENPSAKMTVALEEIKRLIREKNER